jgi:hypothetical protein
MAQFLGSLAASAVEYEEIPPISTPVTSPPYIQHSSPKQSSSSEVSGATLHDVARVGEQNGHAQRPQLAARKFETEIIRPVASLDLSPGRHDHSAPKACRREAASDSDSLTSPTDDEPPSLQRARTQPVTNVSPYSKSRKTSRHRPRPNHLTVGNPFFKSEARVAKDGRLKISVNETTQTGYLAKALGATIEGYLEPRPDAPGPTSESNRVNFGGDTGSKIPRLNIVIMLIGSRGVSALSSSDPSEGQTRHQLELD